MALGLHFDGKLTPLEVDQIELQGRRAEHWRVGRTLVGGQDTGGWAGHWRVGRTLEGCEDTGGWAGHWWAARTLVGGLWYKAG